MPAPQSVCWAFETDTSQSLLVPWEGDSPYRRIHAELNAGNTLVGHNVMFDLAVACVEDRSLLRPAFEALEAGLIRCTMIREQLIRIARGEGRFVVTADDEDGDDTVERTRFDLASCAWRWLRVFVQKQDTWRLRYGELYKKPLAEWPEEARTYSLTDVNITRRVYLAQNSYGPIADEIPQHLYAWALKLVQLWGVRTEAESVARLKTALTKAQAEAITALLPAGLFRVGGTKKAPKYVRTMATIRERVSLAYAQLGEPVPLTKKGAVSTATKTLREAGAVDKSLLTLANALGAMKLLSSFIPVLESGVNQPICAEYNVLVESGRASCIAKGTPIEIVRDVSKFPKGVPIEEVKEGDLAYAFDDQKQLVLRKVLWAGYTGQRKIIRIHWRGSGHQHTGFLDLTEDHLVRLTSGQYRAAGQLQPGDRVLAVSRGISQGYARLWASGHEEITREHRFIYEQVTQSSAEHVHHKNGNKLDNRLANLEGITAADHLSYHGCSPSQELIEKRRRHGKRLCAEGRGINRHSKAGSEHPMYLGLTKEWLELEIRDADGHPTRVAKKHGIDYATLKRYLDDHSIEYRGRRGKGSMRYNHEILRIETLGYTVPVYDLTIEEVENFIAGEICVHNCRKPNMQQLPRGTKEYKPRECFIAREGKAWVSVDYEMAELVAQGQMCIDIVGESVLAQQINAGIKPILSFAGKLAGLDYEATLRAYKAGDANVKRRRQDSKGAMYGLPGGMRAKKLWQTMLAAGNDITPGEAQALEAAWRAEYPEFPRYFQYIQSKVGYNYGDTGTIVQLRSGRVRGGVDYPAACNTFFQGLVADAAKLALYWVVKECYLDPTSPLFGARVVVFAHDELILECDVTKVHQGGYRIAELMKKAAKKLMPDMKMEAEPAAMLRWSKDAYAKFVNDQLVPYDA